MTREIFIEKATKKHNGKYDYSKVNFESPEKEVCIICPRHGEFWQKPVNHLRGYGCKKCQYEKVSEKLSSTAEEFIEKAKKIYGDKYTYDKVQYKKSNIDVCITCPEHGDFFVTPNDFLDGHACKKCAAFSRSKKLSSNTEEFIKKAKLIHGDKYDYSKTEYSGNDIAVCIICPEHGEFFQTPHSHLNGRGCKKCGIDRRSKKRALTLDEFIKKATKKHNGKYDYSLIKEYRNGKDVVPIICKKHGVFQQRAEDHLAGHGCSKCYTSKMEEDLLKYFMSKNENVVYRIKNFNGISELDFYFPTYKTGVECQGKQHFEPVDFCGKGPDAAFKDYKEQVKRDFRKAEECKKQGIRLLYFSDLDIDFPYDIYKDKEKLLEAIKNGPKNEEHL